MDRRLDRGSTTRQQILDTATRLFAERGFEAVSIDAILTACGISKGALYHHFAGKDAVFVAVLESVEARVTAQLAAAAQGATNPLDALRAGCAGWLALAASDPAVRQIVLTDAPTVIGWQAWRAMESEHSLGLLRMAFTAGVYLGRIQADRVEIFSHMLLAVLTEVALLIASPKDDGDAAQTGQAAIEQMLSGLFGIEPGGLWTE